MAIKKLTKDNFKDEIASGITIVDFWASWCGPCRMYGPIFEETSDEVDNATFGKLNVEEEQDIAGEYGVMSIPTTIVFKDGKEVQRQSGVLQKQQLQIILDSVQ